MTHQSVFPTVEIRISTPDQLTAILRHAKQCIANGTLRQVSAANSPFATEDLEAVPDEGPWPDYVEVYFEDCSGRRYRLAVETYHGAGGYWGPA